VNHEDAGVVQGGSGFSFALEARQSLGILAYGVGKELERDKPVQPGVLSFVHDTHAAFTELFDNAVV